MLLRGTGLLSRPLGWVGSAVPFHRIGTRFDERSEASEPRPKGRGDPTYKICVYHTSVGIGEPISSSVCIRG